MINPLYQQMEQNVNSQLNTISLTLRNCTLLIYKLCPQNTYKNPYWDSMTIDYNYVPATMFYATILTLGQMNFIVDYYVGVVNQLLDYIHTNSLQSILIAVINQLNQSITAIDSFAKAMYQGSYSNVIDYTVPYNMSLNTALYLNNIPASNLEITMLYNLGVISLFSFIPKGTVIKLVQ